MAELQPWQRLPGETDKAHQAFVTYRNIEPPFRSITRVVSELNKSRTLIGRWSSQWDWVECAQAWNEEDDRRLLHAPIEARKRMDEEHLRIVRSGRNKTVKALSEVDRTDASPTEVRYWLDTFMKWERLIQGEPENIEEHRTRVEAQEQAKDWDIEKEMEELLPILEDMYHKGELTFPEDDEEEDA